MNLVWFRSDLRIYDNPALHFSMKNGPSMAVYFLTSKQWHAHNMAPIKQDFILRQLATLHKQLEALNVPLVVINADDFSGVVPKIKKLINDYAIQQVFFNQEYEWNEAQLASQVSAQLGASGISVNVYHDQCLLSPGNIRNKQGDYYKVFTAFKNAYMVELNEQMRPLYPRPSAQQALTIKSNISALESMQAEKQPERNEPQKIIWQAVWPTDADYALSLLDEFIDEPIYHYHEERDIPNIQGTSKLSAYLSIGAISVRQCFQAAMTIPNGLDNPGVKTWVTELIWRDFYRHIMHGFPEICRYKAFKIQTDQLPWKHDSRLFEAWCQGRTGYPIVDAAMRQLRETGWMHNRLRMITAMFLTKHLFIDWRLGEQFFMEHLIDGDLASNNGGWQWSASTGVDAVPYFRIFNPTRQSQRFDAQGDFIRQYVPELMALDSKSIHQPSLQQIQQCHYMSPVVDHKTAVAQTKKYFKQLNDSPLGNNKESDLS